VPVGLVMGELTLFTGRTLVRVVHADDLADYDGHRGLALLDDLRPIGATRPVLGLPPPDPELAGWVDTLCGSVPGETVENPMENREILCSLLTALTCTGAHWGRGLVPRPPRARE
jgi:hypothetical protein